MTSRLSSKFGLFRILSLIFIGVFLLVGQVEAAGLFCRSDPTVILSNGVVMDFGANISTLPWNVEEVHYELHVPVGVSRLVSIHTPTWISSKESFTFYADQPADQYIVTVIVGTHEENVAVKLDATLLSPNLMNLHLGTYQAAGFVDQALAILLHL
jgi:hypothetical protein